MIQKPKKLLKLVHDQIQLRHDGTKQWNSIYSISNRLGMKSPSDYYNAKAKVHNSRYTP